MTSVDLLDWQGFLSAGSLVDIFETGAVSHPERLFISDKQIKLT